MQDSGFRSGESSESETQRPLDSGDSLIATHAGMILGTAAYMSPEQARGAAVDNRADIWAFGVVLYEMLTGRRPFAGETIADVLASVVKDEPDLSAVAARHGRGGGAMPEQGAAQSLGKHGRRAMGARRNSAAGPAASRAPPGACATCPGPPRRSGPRLPPRASWIWKSESQPTGNADGDHGAGRHDARACRVGPTGIVSGRPAAGLRCNWQETESAGCGCDRSSRATRPRSREPRMWASFRPGRPIAAGWDSTPTASFKRLT